MEIKEAHLLSRGTKRAYPLLHADKRKKKGSLFPQVAFFNERLKQKWEGSPLLYR